MAHLVNCHLGMHINYSLIKQCYDTVLRFKTVFNTSRCLSTTNFRTWSINMLHNEQNNMPSSTWNVPGELCNFWWIMWKVAIWGQLCEMETSQNIRSPACISRKDENILALFQKYNSFFHPLIKPLKITL